MKILSIFIRVYFALAGLLGLKNLIGLLFKNVDWAMAVYASMFVTLFISVNFLYFAWKLFEILPKRKHWIQSVIFVALSNQLAVAFLGSLGQNQVEIFREMDFKILFMSSIVGIMLYVILIYLIEKLSKYVANSKSSQTVATPKAP